MQLQVEQMQTHIDSLSSGGSGDPGGDPDGIGTMYLLFHFFIYLIYIYTNM